MQYNSPFCGSGFPNYRQFYPCNFSFPPHTIHPEVIGEGDVASVIYPDGSIHFYFIPTSRRNGSYCEHDTHFPYWNNGAGVFYVKSISNPDKLKSNWPMFSICYYTQIKHKVDNVLYTTSLRSGKFHPETESIVRMTAAVFNQQYQKIYRTPFSGPCLYSNCNVNTPTPFQLKFHNDGWTSTTDLRYFYPRLRRCEWQPIASPMECAAVQTDVPAEGPKGCQIVCAKPCLCPRDYNVNDTSSKIDVVDECRCAKVNKSRSRSSISSGRGTSKTKLRKKKSRLSLKKHRQRKLLNKNSNIQCKCQEPSKLLNKNSNIQCKEPSKLSNKNSNVQCKCKEPSKTDKSVTTYADQGSCCTAAERDTQTSFIQELKPIMSQSSKKTEVWFPSSSRCKPVEGKSSEKLIDIFETDVSSASCCCSATDTDDTITKN